MRYCQKYFARLSGFSKKSHLLQIYTARDIFGEILGFAVVGIHEHVGFYLHAATSYKGRSRGVADLLLYECVAYAKRKKCEKFNLMSSPWDQPGLVRYKQKWGATNAIAATKDYSCTRRGAALLWIYRLFGDNGGSAFEAEWLGKMNAASKNDAPL